MTRAKALGGVTIWGVVTALGAALVMTSSSAQQLTVLTASGSSKAAASTGNGNVDPVTGCNPHGNCNGLPKDFGVRVGDLDGLYPGATVNIEVTYSNPNSFPIYVTSATTTAGLMSSSAGTPACSESYLVTGTYPVQAPGLLVPKKASVATTLPIGLSSSAPDACQNAEWTVTVTAQAVK